MVKKEFLPKIFFKICVKNWIPHPFFHSFSPWAAFLADFATFCEAEAQQSWSVKFCLLLSQTETPLSLSLLHFSHGQILVCDFLCFSPLFASSSSWSLTFRGLSSPFFSHCHLLRASFLSNQVPPRFATGSNFWLHSSSHANGLIYIGHAQRDADGRHTAISSALDKGAVGSEGIFFAACCFTR